MINELDYNSVPKNFGLCLNAQCKRADKCLRYQASKFHSGRHALRARAQSEPETDRKEMHRVYRRYAREIRVWLEQDVRQAGS